MTVFAARRSRTSTTTSIGRCTLTNVRGPPTTLGLPPPAFAGRRGPLQDMSLLGKELFGVSSLLPPNVFSKVRPCGRCGVTVPKNPPNQEMRGVVCSECQCLYHQSCENLHKPPRHPGWMCEGCRVANGVL